MLRRKLTAALCSSLLLTLSAAQFAEARNVHPAFRQVSAADCDYYASNFARRASAERELLIGGGLGGLAGFAIGSIFAASGVGAAIGVGAGLLVGTAVRLRREEELYAVSYYDCMSGRPALTSARRQGRWVDRY